MNAEKLMNFYYEPDNAAMVTAWVNYVSPVEGTKELVAAIDQEVADNPLVFPDEATLAKTHVFADLDEGTRQKYAESFQRAVGA
jgi:spermidine/putrescine transport system substrate-binding protein